MHSRNPAVRARPAFASAQGFTLIELLVVIAIIAVLISIVLPALGHARRQARIATTLARLRDTGMGVGLYADANKGKYPVLMDQEEKAFLGLSVLAREHEIPTQAFLNPNLREEASQEQAADGRPILATLAGVEITNSLQIDSGNIAQVRWHCAFSYDNDARHGDDGRPRAFLGDRADYLGGRTFSANWQGQGQCVVWTDMHAAFVRSKALRNQSDPNIYHHNEFGGEGGEEVVDGVSVARATLDTHLRFFSEEEDDQMLPD